MRKYLVLVGVFIFFACKNKTKKCDTPNSISYKNDVQPIFNENCTTSGCHSGSAPAGNLNLDATHSYTDLNNSQSGYLNTSNPESSLLYNSMTSASNPMPPNGKLDKCKLEIIKKWMEQGALNN